jgi:hypothetical protein
VLDWWWSYFHVSFCNMYNIVYVVFRCLKNEMFFMCLKCQRKLYLRRKCQLLLLKKWNLHHLLKVYLPKANTHSSPITLPDELNFVSEKISYKIDSHILSSRNVRDTDSHFFSLNALHPIHIQEQR